LARLVASVLQRNETASETCWRVSRYFKKGKQHGRTYRFRRHSILFLHLGGGRRKGLETMLVLGRMAGVTFRRLGIEVEITVRSNP
jgi:hypothetical protein